MGNLPTVILADQNEVRNQPLLIDYLRQSVEVQTGAVNQTTGSPIVYPDFTIFGGEKLVGVNRKTWGEICSSIDRVEEQLMRELAGPCEQLALTTEGVVVSDGSSGCWVYTFNWATVNPFKNTDRKGTVLFDRQHYNQNYTGIRNWLTRLEWLGIQVIPTQSTYDTAIQLIAMHDLVLKQSESRTLNRLIKQNFTVAALDPTERNLALSLMGLQGARFGEELALAIAGYFDSIHEIICFWDNGGTISGITLKSGRKVGPSAEANLKAALGYSSPNLLGKEQSPQDGLVFNPRDAVEQLPG